MFALGEKASKAALLLAACAVALSAVAVCAGCASSANGSSQASVSAPAPAVPSINDATIVTIQPGAEGNVDLTLSFLLANRNDRECTATYQGAFILYDRAGKSMVTLPISGKPTIAAQVGLPITLPATLTREQLDAWSAVSLVCECHGEGFVRVCCQNPPQSVEQSKQAFYDEEARRAEEEARRAEEEARRLEQERLQAWFAKHPVDDYSDTVLIGDSIMQNSTASLLSALPGVTVNADAGRTLEAGGLVFENSSPSLGVLDHVRNDDGSYGRYVIGTGNNDPGGMTVADAEEIISCLGEDKEIYFITEAMSIASYSEQVTNATIADVVERYPNVHVIDWKGLVSGHESEYLADSCHPRKDREPDYAACVKEGLDTPYPR